MKNLKVSMKLIISFLFVAALTAIVGIVGIIGMRRIDDGATEMYEMQTVPMPYMAHILEEIQMLRVNVREYYIAAVYEDTNRIEAINTEVGDIKRSITGHLNYYVETILSDDAMAIFDDARNQLNTEYAPHLDRVYELAKIGEVQAIRDDINATAGAYNRITTGFSTLLEMKVDAAEANSISNTATADSMLAVIIVVLVLAIIIAMALAFYISGLISKPLLPLVGYMNKAGATGDISLNQSEAETLDKYSQSKDEIGQTIKSFTGFTKRIIEISNELSVVSDGDLSVDIEVLSGNDVLGVSLKKMIDNLNKMFGEINSSTNQVSSGSKQVADGAQALAQGSTEQAASIEELSSSIAEISNMTKHNAQMAEEASKLAETIKDNAEKGSRQMSEMMVAVNDINEASGQISKVIKVIDDIAFQTNILALNAAVEAARAGQHGKGFAVVAEEVRNLAAKSAEAAKDTGSLIENSIEKSHLGVRIADETSESLTEIVNGINESSRLVGEIARSSDEQSEGINQINIGIDQVAQVIQQNSATAEQSAAASEEMSGQSAMLQAMIAQFKLKGGYEIQRSLSPTAPARRSEPQGTDFPVSGGGGDFGKY